MFDLAFFKHDPSVFYSFAREIYPSNFVPSECHRFVRLLELEGKLLRNYSASLSNVLGGKGPTDDGVPPRSAQNIDGLFEQVGVERMLNCHGEESFFPSPLRVKTPDSLYVLNIADLPKFKTGARPAQAPSPPPRASSASATSTAPSSNRTSIAPASPSVRIARPNSNASSGNENWTGRNARGRGNGRGRGGK